MSVDKYVSAMFPYAVWHNGRKLGTYHTRLMAQSVADRHPCATVKHVNAQSGGQQ
jgi:hypothetical protein